VSALATVADILDRERFRPGVIAHRLVYGGPETVEHGVLDHRLRADIEAAVSFAPLHLPAALAVLDAARARYPHLVHVACLDTAFHRHLSPAARRPISSKPGTAATHEPRWRSTCTYRSRPKRVAAMVW
jgi:acetate kinase